MSAYEQFSEDYHQHFTRDPNACVQLGVPRLRDQLPDPSMAAIEATVADAQHLLKRLEDVERAKLSFDQRLDLDLAKLALEAEIHRTSYRFNGATMAEQLPEAGDGLSWGMFSLLVNDPRAPEARLDDLLGRVRAIPGYLEAMLVRLKSPLKRWVEIEKSKIEGMPDLLEAVRRLAEESNYPRQGELAEAEKAARTAFSEYTSGLDKLSTTDQIHIGVGDAQAIIRNRGIQLSPDELHQIARDFISDNRQVLVQLREVLVEKYQLEKDTPIDKLHEYLNQHYAVKVENGRMEMVLDRYQAEREKILAFIKESQLFPVFEEQDMKILQTPSFLEPTIPAGAMQSPPPFREGIRTSLVYLTLKEELLDEHTELGIPCMMIHEGIPGHHLQLATAGIHPSTIRKHADYMDHGEGWTTMLEDYMLDQGYMEDLTDEARFIGKLDIARIGARVGIDLFFMTGDRKYLDIGVEVDTSDPDPFKAAGALLKKVTGFTDGRVQAELNWYSIERGYPLSYLSGNYLVWQLKKDFQTAQAGKLSDLEIDQKFHDIYLHSGNMPVSMLRRVFEEQGLINARTEKSTT